MNRDIDMTALFERAGIHKIERYRALGQYSVVLADGRCGTGTTIGAALADANREGAENVFQVAA